MFFVGRTVIHDRKNFLTNADFLAAKKLLKRGDIVLVGGLRRLSSIFISGPLTHCLIFIGENNFIHSVADGVEPATFDQVFAEYDTMLILRLDHGNKSQIDKMIAFAKKQIGKPYDYDMVHDDSKFYCSELLYFAFHHAGLNLEIFTEKEHLSIASGTLKIKRLHPMTYIGGRFDVVFQSESLDIVNGEVKLHQRHRKNIFAKLARRILAPFHGGSGGA